MLLLHSGPCFFKLLGVLDLSLLEFHDGLIIDLLELPLVVCIDLGLDILPFLITRWLFVAESAGFLSLFVTELIVSQLLLIIDCARSYVVKLVHIPDFLGCFDHFSRFDVVELIQTFLLIARVISICLLIHR